MMNNKALVSKKGCAYCILYNLLKTDTRELGPKGRHSTVQLLEQRQDTQHNDSQDNDTQYNNTQENDIQYNDTQHDTQHNDT